MPSAARSTSQLPKYNPQASLPGFDAIRGSIIDQALRSGREQATAARVRPWSANDAAWNDPNREIVVDLFAGGGGATEGIEDAIGHPVDIAVNHDSNALLLHSLNHPDTEHYIEDVFAVDPVKACRGRSVGLLWASPTCTFFSSARSGGPLDYHEARRVRGLAWVVVRWAATVRPRVISTENVPVEQLHWCRLGPNGRANMKYRGEYFRKWVNQLRALGYHVEWKVLSAADYGAPTIRKRLFVIARCDGQPIEWPAATHGPNAAQPHVPAADCINWNDRGSSIFGRKKPLAKKSLERIAAGVVRYILKAANPYIVPTADQDPSGPITLPHVTIYRGNRVGAPIDQPLHTITSGAGSKRPAGAAHAMGVVQATAVPVEDLRSGCLVKYYKEGGQHQSLADPAHTITTKHRLGLVEAAFMAQHNEDAIARSLHDPLATVLKKGSQQQLVTAALTEFYSSNERGAGGDLRQPTGTILARGTHHGLLQGDLVAGVEESPEAMRVAKFLRRYYKPSKRDGEVSEETLNGVMVRHGVRFQLTDIRQRMLEPEELWKANGFGDHYITQPVCYYTTKKGQLKFGRYPKHESVAKCGNSVCPPIARALVAANYRPRFVQFAAAA